MTWMLIDWLLWFKVATTAIGTKQGLDEQARKEAMDQARQVMLQLEADAKAAKREAQSRKDAVATARAEARLARLRSLERRTDLRRLGDRVDDAHARWKDHAQRSAVADQAGGWFFGKLGAFFGGAKERAIDAGSTLGMWQQGNATAPQSSGINSQHLLDSILAGTDELQRLPDNASEYLARELYRKVLRENPQMAHEDPSEVYTFMCKQAGAELDAMMRASTNNEDAEVIRHAREDLCSRHLATGTLNLQGEAAKAQPLLTQRQIRLSWTQGGEVTGTLEIQIEAGPEILDDFARGIGEAAGGAAAAAVGGGSDKGSKNQEPLNCRIDGRMVFDVEGRHDGQSKITGSLTLRPGATLVGGCKGERKSMEPGKLAKGPAKLTGTDLGQEFSLRVSWGDFVLAGQVSSGR